jgi:leucyl-tRNA synthetase
LPLELPYIKSYKASDDGSSPLAKIPDFVNTTCPNCSSPAIRETDTMPNWAGSCWYYLAFSSKIGTKDDSIKFLFRVNSSQNSSNIHSRKNFISPSFINNNWLPVYWYFGGSEHAVLHLLYSRFWIHILNDLGLVNFREPFLRLHSVGMVIAEDGRKMSKSFGNVINPDAIVKEYGADTLRVYEMFMAPFSQQVAWSTKNLQGSYRFISKIWQIYNNSANITDDINREDKQLVSELQTLISIISADITNVKFNTAISSFMKFLNFWQETNNTIDNDQLTINQGQKVTDNKKNLNNTKGNRSQLSDRKLSTNNAKVFLKLLAPFAPFITEEIWHNIFKEQESIHLSQWPVSDKTQQLKKDYTIPVQVNGKVRDIIKVGEDQLGEENIVESALKSDKIKKWLNGKKYKIIYIQSKILNIVVN